MNIVIIYQKMKIGKHINLENPTEKLNKSCTSKSYFISKLLNQSYNKRLKKGTIEEENLGNVTKNIQNIFTNDDKKRKAIHYVINLRRDENSGPSSDVSKVLINNKKIEENKINKNKNLSGKNIIAFNDFNSNNNFENINRVNKPYCIRVDKTNYNKIKNKRKYNIMAIKDNIKKNKSLEQKDYNEKAFNRQQYRNTIETANYNNYKNNQNGNDFFMNIAKNNRDDPYSKFIENKNNRNYSFYENKRNIVNNNLIKSKLLSNTFNQDEKNDKNFILNNLNNQKNNMFNTQINFNYNSNANKKYYLDKNLLYQKAINSINTININENGIKSKEKEKDFATKPIKSNIISKKNKNKKFSIEKLIKSNQSEYSIKSSYKNNFVFKSEKDIINYIKKIYEEKNLKEILGLDNHKENEEIKKYKEENEKLKEEIEILKDENEQCKVELNDIRNLYNDLNKELNIAYEENEKLKDTFINNILEDDINNNINE